MLQVHEFSYDVERLENGQDNKDRVTECARFHGKGKQELYRCQGYQNEKGLPDYFGLRLWNITGLLEIVRVVRMSCHSVFYVLSSTWRKPGTTLFLNYSR